MECIIDGGRFKTYLVSYQQPATSKKDEILPKKQIKKTINKNIKKNRKIENKLAVYSG